MPVAVSGELADLPLDERMDLFRSIEFFGVGPWDASSERADSQICE
jgi:hypothetical protein